MSDYNYEIIKALVLKWYDKELSELKNPKYKAVNHCFGN